MREIPYNYEKILEIRAFEEALLKLFEENLISGTIHTCIGQEATAVAAMKYVGTRDHIFSNHRCHGHYLAYGGPPRALLAEIMSKESGLCQGKGGSQHIHYKNFFSNGIQGGIVPNAVGVAFADKLAATGGRAIVFLGDGTLGEGIVYEAFNIAAVYALPVLFIVEDNQYAMSTKKSDMFSGDIRERITGFGIPAYEIESTDVNDLEKFFSKVFKKLSQRKSPICAIVHNYRLGPHSKGDDFRDKNEILEHRKNDPIVYIKNEFGEDFCNSLLTQKKKEFRELAMQIANEDELNDDIGCIWENETKGEGDFSALGFFHDYHVGRIKEAFADALAHYKNLVMIGEDIKDPYGGAFRGTKGLSTAFPQQVFNMPISEACMVGMAVGMSLNHLIPIVEIMFGDFVTLAFDQILNHASKYEWIYGNGVTLPLVIRFPSGAGRGYGATHSQSVEKFLVGIPGIRTIALAFCFDPYVIYRELFRSVCHPTIVVENKQLYSRTSALISNNEYDGFEVKEIKSHDFPSVRFTADSSDKADFYAITYGGMSECVIEAAKELMIIEEIQVDVIVISQLSPLPILDLQEFIPADGCVLTIEEGTKTAGIGAEVIASCIEKGIGNQFFRIAAKDTPIPCGKRLEKLVIPDAERIVEQIRGFYYENRN